MSVLPLDRCAVHLQNFRGKEKVRTLNFSDFHGCLSNGFPQNWLKCVYGSP